ncbi:LysR family transcriptional regulator [Pseudooctadecabacter jejudonensis]|uniref:Nodulation protein D 2 n=1 Tax=Pseudooctadecabacter jejudonensis TaxID=1391910 RepID=A0A1Y5SLI5_9RHOB|nr:LysR family transcriptional regulator [Pseudooctadecabacter jejudonensis]SLN41779.1 Nodulation protein D 2 [Pseudooctadecabacter jejudonensis]
MKLTPKTPNIDHIDLKLISALIALIEERSTTLAAQRLHLAQSTVSGTLARLREIFDDELLVRQGRELVPTARAEELLEAVRPHYDGLAAALGEVSAFDPAEDARVFTLGCTDAFALAALPRLTQSLRQTAPYCDLSVRVGDYLTLPAMLSSGDVSTVAGYLRDEAGATAKTRTLRNAPWVVLRNADAPVIDGTDDFCARPHALVTPMGDLSGFVDDQLASIDKDRRIVIGLSSFALILPTLPGTDLITTVPDFVANALMRHANFAVDPCPVAVPPVKNALTWSATAHRNPAEIWFRDTVTKAFDEA